MQPVLVRGQTDHLDRRKPLGRVPTRELTVKGTNIAYIEFSGPRPGEYLVADEIRFTPVPAAVK